MRIKPIEDLLGEGTESGADGGHKLRRRLGALDLVGFGVGIVVGTGLFTLTGIAAQVAGPAVVISFAIAGVVTILAALCYAELASSVPVAGSAYTYAYATAGETIAWIIGWVLVLEFALGAAVVSRGWSGYLTELLNLPGSWFGDESKHNIGAAAIALLMGVIAMIGIRPSARVTKTLVVVKVAICLLVIVVGALYVRVANLTPFVPSPRAPEGQEMGKPLFQLILGVQPVSFGVVGILTATALVFFAYLGFESVASLAEETRNPSRTLSLGLVGTIVIAMVLYVGVSFVTVGMVNYSKVDSDAPIAAAFSAVGASWMAVTVSIAVIAALTGVILASLVAVSRVVFTMARDGLLPARMGAVHPRWRTPYIATGLIAVGVAVLAGILPLAELADLVNLGALLAFLITAVAVVVLRRTSPDLRRPFRVPLSPVIPVASALTSFALMTTLTVDTWLRLLGWLIVGVAIYLAYGRRHSRLAPAPGRDRETGRES